MDTEGASGLKTIVHGHTPEMGTIVDGRTTDAPLILDKFDLGLVMELQTLPDTVLKKMRRMIEMDWRLAQVLRAMGKADLFEICRIGAVVYMCYTHTHTHTHSASILVSLLSLILILLLLLLQLLLLILLVLILILLLSLLQLLLLILLLL